MCNLFRFCIVQISTIIGKSTTSFSRTTTLFVVYYCFYYLSSWVSPTHTNYTSMCKLSNPRYLDLQIYYQVYSKDILFHLVINFCCFPRIYYYNFLFSRFLWLLIFSTTDLLQSFHFVVFLLLSACLSLKFIFFTCRKIFKMFYGSFLNQFLAASVAKICFEKIIFSGENMNFPVD